MKRKAISLQQQFLLTFAVAMLPAFLVFGIVANVVGITIIQNQIAQQKGAIVAYLLESANRYQDQSVRAIEDIEYLIGDSTVLSGEKLESVTSHLESMLRVFPHFKSIQIADRNGTVQVVVPFQRDMLGNDESKQPYFIQGSKGRYWSSAFISASTGNATVTLSAPTGAYVTSIFLDLHPLQISLQTIHAQTSGTITVTDELGTIIADSDPLKVLRREKFAYDMPGTVSEAQRRISDPEQGWLIIYSVPINRTGWEIHIVQPEDSIYGSLRTYVLLMGVLLIFAVASALGMSVWRTKTLVNQVRGFIEATSLVGKGRYEKLSIHSGAREFQVLAEHFNTMIDSIFLREDRIMQLNANLEQRVKDRTRELERSNTELKETLDTLRTAQDQLVSSEKLAAVGQLVAGVAHEINTPVGISLTASTFLEGRARAINGQFKDNALSRTDFETFLNAAIESSQIIARNLDRASELIRSFKQVAVDHSVDERREFNVAEYFSEIVQNIKPSFKHRKIEVITDIDPVLVILSYPAGFSQVLTNLIMNSLIHGFEKSDSGTIRIEAGIVGDSFRLVYSDDGKGIPQDLHTRIFEPFFTTKRNEGSTGLGMHIVYSIVRNQLSGSIVSEPPPVRGARFVITIPSSVCAPSELKLGAGN